MSSITPVALALGVGVAGAMVDVTSFLTGTSVVSCSWGQRDQYRGVEPGTFSFTLDNYDGRFTPGNVMSALSTPIQEGTRVCWQLGTRLMTGSILNFQFPSSADERGRITITCDDALGDLARYTMPDKGFIPALEQLADQRLLWRLDEGSGATQSVEASNTGIPAFVPMPYAYFVSGGGTYPGVQTLTYGVKLPGFMGQTGLNISNFNLTDPFSDIGGIEAAMWRVNNFQFTGDSGGYYGFWADTLMGNGEFRFYCAAESSYYFTFRATTNGVGLTGTNPSSSVTTTVTPGPHYYAIGISATFAASQWTVRGTLYIDGVSVGYSDCYPQTSWGTLNRNPALIGLYVTAPVSVTVSRVGFYMNLPHPEIANVNTIPGLLNYYDTVVPTLGTIAVSGSMSTNPIGQTVQTGKALDAINAIVKTEQGYVYPVVSGTVTNPSTVVTFRERTRALTPKVTFDAVADIDGVLAFERNLTNTVSTETVSGDGPSVTFTDSTITGRASYSTGSDSIMNSQSADVLMWATDRVNRGKVTSPWPTKITIDAANTSTDRKADLLGLVPGDRIRITNINSAVTGFSTWDGWLIGANETHTLYRDVWELYLAPCSDQGVFDTSVVQSDGDLSLVSAVTSGATSVTVATSGSYNLSDATVLPVTIQIDGEQMTVTATAVSGANYALTVTRGVNGTAAAAHVAGEPVWLLPPSVYAF